MSLEWYFKQFSTLTVAAFHKDISDHFASDFETRRLALAVRDGSTLPVDVLVATPTNVGDAAISGIEFGYTNKLPFGIVDLGASFKLRPNVELFMQAVNLLDQRQVSFAGTQREVSEIHTFGRSLNFGVRAKF